MFDSDINDDTVGVINGQPLGVQLAGGGVTDQTYAVQASGGAYGTQTTDIATVDSLELMQDDLFDQKKRILHNQFVRTSKYGRG